MAKLPFITNQSYHRVDEIHKIYGGNWQSGICPSSKYPYIFIFSGESGQKHGYRDSWISKNEFLYSGHGQVGDMEFAKGNLALRNHLQNGRHVFLFEKSRPNYVKFIGELEFLDLDFFKTHDTNGKSRTGIQFRFKRKDSQEPLQSGIFNPVSQVAEPLERYSKLPIEVDGVVNSKVGQGDYLKGIIRRWEYKCAVTGFDNLNLLIASNIEPWPEDDQPKIQDIDNGILLSPTYDALFEKHLISFKDSGKIMLSSTIEKNAFQKIGISGKEAIKGLNDYNLIYLDKHRSRFNDAH